MKPERDVFKRHIRPLAPLPTGMAPDLSGMRDFAAIVFDVYGTLLISAAGEIGTQPPSDLQLPALTALLGRYGIAQSADTLAHALRQAVARSHADSRQQGIDWPEVDIVRIWQEVLDENDPSRAAAWALEYELIVNPVYPMPGLEALLSHCRRQQVHMGIISNVQFFTPWQLVYFLGKPLDALGFDPRLVFFSWQWGHAKPALFMFAKARAVLADMGIADESVLYVGNDMRNDIAPAKAMGFTTALFAGDRRSLRLSADDACCRSHAPDLVVTDLRQLIGTDSNGP